MQLLLCYPASMSEVGPRKPPEAVPEVGSEAPGSRWLTMPVIGALLGMSERAARDWVRRHDLPTHGTRPVRVSEQVVLAQMAAEERVTRKPPEVAGSREPIEAEYRVTPEDLQVAIERTGAKYINDFTGLYEMINEALAKQYEARLAERDLALAAKDETIATQRLALASQADRLAEQQAVLAETRRRAEAIGAEYVRRREEDERERLKAAQAALDPPGSTEAAGAINPRSEAPEGFWARVRRVFTGDLSDLRPAARHLSATPYQRRALGATGHRDRRGGADRPPRSAYRPVAARRKAGVAQRPRVAYCPCRPLLLWLM
jgi:hypothetical protein